MDWFRPSSESISFLAEICLLTVILVYILSLQGKTRDTRLYIGYLIVLFVWCVVGFLYNSNIGSTPAGKNYIDWITGFLTPGRSIYMLWFAYQFGSNPFRREMFSVIILLIVLFNLPLVIQFDSEITLFIPISIFMTLLHILTSLYACIILLRKMARLAKINRGNNQSISGEKILFREKNSFSEELLQPSGRETKAYKGLAIWAFISFCIWLFYLAQITRMINYFVWACALHILLLVSMIQSTVVFLNYAREKHSFQAKLVGVVLCVVMIVFGLLPYALFGEGLPTASDPHPEIRLKIFLLLIPVATVITILILPLTFQYNILRPLEKIIEGVKQVNEGNLQTSIKVEVNDEIGTLTTHFNKMTQSLSAYSGKMEELVAERTAELNRSLENLKSTQAQLIHSEKMASLGELTAGIAHEIQNPLNFVNNFSEINTELIDEATLAMEQGKQNEMRPLLEDLRDNQEKILLHGKRAEAIVKNMLQHSRVSTGKKESTDINAFCDEYLKLSYHGLRAKDKSFQSEYITDFDPHLPKAEVIQQEFGRVLLNLLNNAFYVVHKKYLDQAIDKFIPPGGPYKPLVTITTRKVNEDIQISIADNGTGIPENILDKIFQPFFTTKPTGQGTGLGLSLAYDIVKAHGGKIIVTSNYGPPGGKIVVTSNSGPPGELKIESKEGSGSEFIIQLPVA